MCALISITQEPDNNILRIDRLGKDLVDNDVLIKDITETITTMIDGGRLIGGKIIKVNGPMTVHMAFVLAHKLAPLFETVAVYDLRLEKIKYVVVIVNGGKYRVGDLID